MDPSLCFCHLPVSSCQKRSIKINRGPGWATGNTDLEDFSGDDEHAVQKTPDSFLSLVPDQILAVTSSGDLTVCFPTRPGSLARSLSLSLFLSLSQPYMFSPEELMHFPFLIVCQSTEREII